MEEHGTWHLKSEPDKYLRKARMSFSVWKYFWVNYQQILHSRGFLFNIVKFSCIKKTRN